MHTQTTVKDSLLMVDNFYDKANELRDFAINADTETVEFAGDEYHGIIRPTPDTGFSIRASIEKNIGRDIEQKLIFMRSENKDNKPTHWIHSDQSVASMSAILYLSHDSRGGTAFWDHNIAGENDDSPEVRDYIGADEFDQSRWTLRGLAGYKFNRCIIFDGSRFHSRYPFESWGNDQSDSRLTLVSFFDVIDS